LVVRVGFVVMSARTQRPTYTTQHLAFESARRGHEVLFVGVDALTHGDDGRVLATASRPAGATLPEFCASLAAAAREDICLSDLDVVFLRANPNLRDGERRDNPAVEFGRLLKRAGARVVNDPDGLLRAGSKMYLTGFPDEIRPRTLVTRSAAEIKTFLRELGGPGILKPLHGYGGRNVFYVRRKQRANLDSIIEAVSRDGYVIAQEYLPAVARGDKRVLLWRGVPIRVGDRVAAYRRMRPPDDIRSNMHAGGKRMRCDFHDVDARTCDALRPRLVADGLDLVGVDLVGDKVLEINVFAPGGIHNINALYGINVATEVIRALEDGVAK
jgi:glutathione synthase